jgi:hypothetical protein
VDQAILVRYFGREDAARLLGKGEDSQAPDIAA